MASDAPIPRLERGFFSWFRKNPSAVDDAITIINQLAALEIAFGGKRFPVRYAGENALIDLKETIVSSTAALPAIAAYTILANTTAGLAVPTATSDLVLTSIKFGATGGLLNGSSGSITLAPSGSGYIVLDGSVGIGVSSPTDLLHLKSTTAAFQRFLTLETTSSTGIAIQRFKNNAVTWQCALGGSGTTLGNAWYIYDETNGSFRLSISAGGALRLHAYTAGTLKTDANGNVTAVAGASITGPANSTDLALVRWDGTAGNAVLDSNVTLATSGTAFVFATDGGISAGGSNKSITFTPTGTGGVFATTKLFAGSSTAFGDQFASTGRTLNAKDDVLIKTSSSSVDPSVNIENSDQSGFAAFGVRKPSDGGYFFIASKVSTDIAQWGASASSPAVRIKAGNGESGAVLIATTTDDGANKLQVNGGGKFTAITATSGTLAGLTGLAIRDTSAAFDVTLAATSSTTLTAARTLTIDVTNAARTLKLTGNPTLADWFDQAVKVASSVEFGALSINGGTGGNVNVKQTNNSTTGGFRSIRSDNSTYTTFYMGGDDKFYFDNRSAAGGHEFYTNSSRLGGIGPSGFDVVGPISTTAPSGASAGAWKLGSLVTGAVVADATRSLYVDVGGTVYKLMVST